VTPIEIVRHEDRSDSLVSGSSEQSLSSIEENTLRRYLPSGRLNKTNKRIGQFVGLAGVFFFIVLLSSIKVVDMNQQLLFKTSTGWVVRNGPFTTLVWPHQRMERREATRISQRQYAVVKDLHTEILQHYTTPGLLFLGAYQELVRVSDKIVLRRYDYIRLVDTFTGFERVLAGPQVVVPGPLEESPDGPQLCPVIGPKTSVLVEDRISGLRQVVTRKGIFVPVPYQQVVSLREATVMESSQFAVVKDELSGQFRNEEGPQLLHLGPYESLGDVREKLLLEKGQYVRLVDSRTGAERISVGPALVVPDPYEESSEGQEAAVHLTATTAALVLNKTNGQQHLVVKVGVFTPKPYEKVLETRHRIHVLPHQAAIVRNPLGDLLIMRNETSSLTFFLQPFHTMVQFEWSSYKTPRVLEPGPKEKVTLIDMRVQRLLFASELRTSDNVKLRLEGTAFWRVMDVATMAAMTSDAPRDVAQRVKRTMLHTLSRTTLEVFMKDLSNITAEASRQAVSESFYSDRGLQLETLMITQFEPVENSTSQVLQTIVGESCKRINELEKAKNMNDISSAKLMNEISLEDYRTQLIRAKATNLRLESLMGGEASGSRLMQVAGTFIGGLEPTVQSISERLRIYKMQENLKGRNSNVKTLASGGARLMLTPLKFSLKLNRGS